MSHLALTFYEQRKYEKALYWPCRRHRIVLLRSGAMQAPWTCWAAIEMPWPFIDGCKLWRGSCIPPSALTFVCDTASTRRPPRDG
jgi:hypothetical protein